MGFRLSLRGWAARLGLNYDVLRLRLAKGWAPQQAFETPIDDAELAPAAAEFEKRKVANNQRRHARILEYEGERRTISEWAKHLGIPRITIDVRLKKGYPTGQALGIEPIKFDYSWRCRKLTYKGETLTTKEWAERLHVSLCQFCVRIRQDLPEEKLFAENHRLRKRRERELRTRQPNAQSQPVP